MSQVVLLFFIGFYFLILLFVAWLTGRNSTNDTFFTGNKNSNWMLVAFGMIGTSLSGVTFVSVPGAVATDGFSYFQIGIGYLLGYIAIAFVLLPLYYRLNLSSIYHYLSTRFGIVSYKTGAFIFIVSRTLGATARLYLVVKILQDNILESMGMPFWATTLLILIMILLYTVKGGVKTIVWTDTLQTICMLSGLLICVVLILNYLHLNVSESLALMSDKGYTSIFNFHPDSKQFFVKQILAGAFITITMTGMDQEMMQKNISVKKLGNSQKNVLSLAVIMLVVILLFLFLGGLLYLYASNLNVNLSGDKLFPTLALHHMPPYVSIIFIIALISALFPSADGAITALTASFCLDIVGINRNAHWSDEKKNKIRQWVHIGFALLFLQFVLMYKWINDPSMIKLILKIASYTYGPLLGLFAFGILTKRTTKEFWVPFVCVGAPMLCWVIDLNQKQLFGSFEIGLELLIINGFLTFMGLLFISKSAATQNATT